MHDMRDDIETTRAVINRLMELTGMQLTQLAKAAGLATSTLTRFMNGTPSHNLNMNTLLRLSQATGISLEQMTTGSTSARPCQRGRSTPGARFRAVREIVWRHHGGPVRAAEDLGISPADLLEIESGTKVAPPEVLLRFAQLTRCTIDFLLDGDSKGLRVGLAAHLAQEAPELVPDLLSDSAVSPARSQNTAPVPTHA